MPRFLLQRRRASPFRSTFIMISLPESASIVGRRKSKVYFAESSISAASARVRRLISSALKRRTSCEENHGEGGCGDFLLSWSNANASRSTTDVENKNNPGMILVGIRVTDKKAPLPSWRKPQALRQVPLHPEKKSLSPEFKIHLRTIFLTALVAGIVVASLFSGCPTTGQSGGEAISRGF